MQNKPDHFIDWLTLVLTPGLGPRNIRRLLEQFGSPAGVFRASRKQLTSIAGLQPRVVDALENRTAATFAKREESLLVSAGATLICWDDPRYPELLRNIPDAPPLLYGKGNVALLEKPAIAVVGSRASTAYGKGVARDIAAQLAREGLCVISGLALGIDTAAHTGALDAGGDTVAVLGCGVDVVYPPQNRKLYDRIAASGLLLSEYPFGSKPDAFRFPARNRIISGLAYGVLVVEAAQRSGSLITARLALDYGREVFAVPGRVDSLKSAGPHRLLQDGAKLVHSIDDILEELPFFTRRPETSKTMPTVQASLENMTEEEQKLFVALEVYPKIVDEIIATVNMPARKVSEILLSLELKGIVESLPGNQYQRKGAH